MTLLELSSRFNVEGLVQLIVAIIMFLFVLFLAYLAARIAGRFQNNVVSRGNIRIMETSRIANNKYIQIVKIGTRYYAIAVGKEEVTLLAELMPEDLYLSEGDGADKGSFSDILDNLRNKKKEDKSDEE